MYFTDRRNDVGIGAATANVSRHPLADLIIGKLQGRRFLPQVFGDIAGITVFRFA
jgi:hypothetical protein